ncbi:MAG: hypothetical protein ACI3XY_06100 [Butyricicoccaceae bacterium]
MLIEYSFDAVLIGMVALFIIVILIMVYRGQKRNPDRSAGEYYADLRRKYDAEQAAKAEEEQAAQNGQTVQAKSTPTEDNP